MEFLADTVAIIRYFTKYGRIGKKAKEIFKSADKGENVIWISVISLVEVMYLAERNKISLDLRELKLSLEGLDNYKIIDLYIDIVLIADKIKDLELHDRLIVASAKYLGISILTSDKKIIDSGEIKVVWQ